MITPQYIADLVSWGAIGARTTESQVHRELASGLSCPVGFKNGTDGNVRIAMDAIRAAQAPHHFLSVTKDGHSAIVSTARQRGLPHHPARRQAAQLRRRQRRRRGEKSRRSRHPGAHHDRLQPRQQRQRAGQTSRVGPDVAAQVAAGDARIFGVMVESHLKAGRQDLIPGKALVYGQSITDACIGWEDSRDFDRHASPTRCANAASKPRQNGESE